MENILKLKKGETISIINSKNEGVLIRNENNVLKVTKTKKEYSNIRIYNAELVEIMNYVFAYLLEEYNKISMNNKSISTILDNYYDLFLGKENNSKDINKIEFQIISHF